VNAPGWPGLPPTWTSSDKDLVGTALGPGRVWYTLGHGILDEVYWPSCSTPQIRDLGFIVAGDGFWAEVKRENRYELSTPAPDVPLPTVVHRHERYRLELEVLADPLRDVVLVHYRLEGKGLKLYALLAPHLEGSGHGNSAEVQPQGLAAMTPDAGLWLAADRGFSRASAGYVGASDGWQDFHRHGAMTWHHDAAPNGNVALIGELADNEGVLALGFADTVEGARTLALSSLACGFEAARAPLWWPASACRGATPATIPAATTWCGRATRWSPASRCSPAATTRRRVPCSPTWSPPSSPTATGCRTSMPTAGPTGAACSSTRPRCRCCWPRGWTSSASWAICAPRPP
jgi:hypothetical protein